jgi:hypothetical protein
LGSLLILLALRHGSSQKSLPTSGRTALEGNGNRTTPTSFTSMQVSVHKAREQPSTLQTKHFGTDITGQPHVKPHELAVDLAGDHEMESGSENSVV